jgi:hypothetical protein
MVELTTKTNFGRLARKDFLFAEDYLNLNHGMFKYWLLPILLFEDNPVIPRPL